MRIALIGRFREGDPVRRPINHTVHADLWHPVLTLMHEQVIAEAFEALEHDGVAMRHHLDCIGQRAAGDRQRDQPEVAARIVDAQVEVLAVMIEVVLLFGQSRLEAARSGCRYGFGASPAM